MYGLTVSTPATEEPITLDEAKKNLRYPYDTEDSLIQSLIVAARRYCETVTGRAFCTQTVKLTLDCFHEVIHLPKSPVQSVSSITYYDTANVQQTLSALLYQADVRSLPPRVVSVDGQVWPLTYSRLAAIEVTYVAGYGAASVVPQTIKQAMLLLVAHWFNNREAAGDSRVEKVTALAVKSLLGVEWDGNVTGAY